MIYWDIPYVNMFSYGNKQHDPLGCWYACVCMVAFCYGEGPRLGVPELYCRPTTNESGASFLGHYPIDMSPTMDAESKMHLQQLTRNEGLRRMIAPDSWCNRASKIASVLKKFGPLIVTRPNPPGRSGRRYSHCAVLTGIKDLNP
ncbi:papain-like cysteine protease family protein [Kistimonas scapharcae]|uniref:papain-like cysteine protease family protein n=1 Tax=Kistimonas scapharcae TaxID=1036133 RepID=UPI003CD06E3A